jgi:imidazoleglycerol-phosphate dehydratase
MSRTAEINRETKETKVRLRLDLDGGEAKVSTGVGFLDHMLELLARHGRLGLEVEASGDLETGAHHTTEDVGFDSELTEEFFRALSNNSKMTLHVWVRSGSNAHHMIEASFKAFARALRVAVSIDPDESGVPSTKGTLTE